jgi:ferredoxin
MTQKYPVEITYDGQTRMIEVAEDEQILQVALDAGFELPHSCTAGVCTTCAGQVLEGELTQEDAMGVSPALQAEGYALLCVARPRSPLKIVAGKEDEIYERQFGQG